MDNQLEKGDVIALKNGKRVEVLSVRTDGNTLLRFDYIDRSEVSPMRRTEYPSAISAMLQKSKNRSNDPKDERPYDNPKPKPQEVIVVNGKEFIENIKAPQQNHDNINHQVGLGGHDAIKEGPKPILTRVKPVTTGKAK